MKLKRWLLSLGFSTLQPFRNWLCTSLLRGTRTVQGHGGICLLVLEANHDDVSKLKWKPGSFIQSSLPSPPLLPPSKLPPFTHLRTYLCKALFCQNEEENYQGETFICFLTFNPCTWFPWLKDSTHFPALSLAMSIHWGSWNLSPKDKGGLLGRMDRRT